MKPVLLTLTVLFFSFLCSAQTTYIPDDNFEQALIDLGYDSGALDDQVLTENINSITNLNISSKNIADLTGIEDFTALQNLTCYTNQLTSVDLSQNIALTVLYIYDNQLTTIDVTQNINLVVLYCHHNFLTTLDVSQNLLLQSFICRYNLLTNIDVSLNTLLFDFDFSGNQLTTIDLSQNTNLAYLLCQYNNLSALNLSLNTSLIHLTCQVNQLTNLNIKNGNNTNIIVYISNINPNLLCINVDDIVYADANFTQIDAVSSFSTNCSGITYNLNVNTIGDGTVNPNSGVFIENDTVELLATPNNGWIFDNWSGDASGNTNPLTVTMDSDKNITANFSVLQTYIPDDNFEQALIDLGYDSGTLDDNVPTINISSITNLNINNLSISDLTGIEDFSSLEFFNCNTNLLTNIDVTQNTSLIHLECEANQLTTIDVTQNTLLEGLRFSDNQLTSIDISQNPALYNLFCNDNSITNLDLSQNPNLFNLRCFNNNLSNLDVSQNTNLDTLECMNNGIISMDLSQNISLDYFRCFDNQFGSLDLSQNSLLTYLDCSNNELTNLNIKNGNNTNIIFFSAITNQDLICIEVDNTSYAISNFTYIDANSGFSENCNSNIFDLTVQVVGNGSTSLFGSYTILNGNEVSITATPNAGWEFTNWSDDASGTTNPLTFIMDANKTITANFDIVLGNNDFQNSGFSISPNPVKNTINIETEEHIEKVWIYNMLGQQIMVTTKKNISVSNLKAGIYTIKFLTNKSQLVTKRFIKL